MSTASDPVRRHYDTMLAPIYAWMVGDPDAAQARAREEVHSIGPFRPGAVAVDLGAGLGFHARALAEAGHQRVWMVETNAQLLTAAQGWVGDDGVHGVAADLRDFTDHVERGPVDTIVCMGDTLTHLPGREAVADLLATIANSLRPGGVFLTTFRDYTQELTGPDRFVPVRSDDQRILTAFLEYAADVVTVHDMLQERHDAGWSLAVGAYPKARIDPAWVVTLLTGHGLVVEPGTTTAGMTRISARR